MSMVIDEQQAIEDHLKLWAYWYTRLHKISTRAIRFETWEEEEAAGDEAWDKWDEAFCWLEQHGITNEQIVYDEAMEQATIRPVSL